MNLLTKEQVKEAENNVEIIVYANTTVFFSFVFFLLSVLGSYILFQGAMKILNTKFRLFHLYDVKYIMCMMSAKLRERIYYGYMGVIHSLICEFCCLQYALIELASQMFLN